MRLASQIVLGVLAALGAVILACVVLLLACPQAHGQDLPDAPSAIVRQPDGTYCIGSTCGWRQADITAPQATFLTFRSDWNAAPLRTNRQAFNKKFVLLHAGAFLAVVAACRDRSSTENPGCWGSELPAVMAMTGFDYAATRLVCECFSVEAPIYAMYHYGKAATR